MKYKSILKEKTSKIVTKLMMISRPKKPPNLPTLIILLQTLEITKNEGLLLEKCMFANESRYLLLDLLAIVCRTWKHSTVSFPCLANPFFLNSRGFYSSSSYLCFWYFLFGQKTVKLCESIFSTVLFLGFKDHT